MLQNRQKIGALAVLAPIVFAPLCSAAGVEESPWRWVRIQPSNADGWAVMQGTANVIFDGRNFSTTLIYDTDKYYNHFTLTGTIDGSKVTASEVKLNTDGNRVSYQGAIEHERTPPNSPAGGWGSDRIVLNSDGWFIGLYRTVPPGTP